MSADALYQARGLHITYQRGRRPPVRAVDGVDLTWRRGETLGLVGESGCGKSTLARALLGLETPSAGSIEFDQQPVDRDLRALRRRVQLIFQDPYESLNPRRTVGASVQEGLAAIGMPDGQERVQRGVSALHDAGLAPADRFWRRYPHETRADRVSESCSPPQLVLEPEALCATRVSALDRLFAHPGAAPSPSCARRACAIHALITHDVGVGWSLWRSSGRDVPRPHCRDRNDRSRVLADPQHPYTGALLAVVPIVERRMSARALLTGEPPDAAAIPNGCRFHPRSPSRPCRCPVD